jgi:type I restriction enzyme S subunit
VSFPTVQIRRMGTVLNGGTPTPDPGNWDGDVPWATPVDLGRVNGGSVRATERTLTLAGAISGSTIAPAGSVILSTRAPIGYAAIGEVATAFNQGCKALVPQAGVDSRYLRYAVEATLQELISLGRGSTFTELNSADLASHKVPRASFDLQRQIADYLDHETAEIDAFIADLQLERSLSRERHLAHRDLIFGSQVADAQLAELRGKIAESDIRAGSAASSTQLLTVSIATGVTPRDEWTADEYRADDLTRYKLVQPDDIVLNRMRAFQGAVGVSAAEGITSPDYAVLRCNQRVLVPEFAANLFKSPRFVSEIARRLRGIGSEESGQVRTPRVSVADLIRIPTRVPEVEDQHRAVHEWNLRHRVTMDTLTDIDAAIALANERRAALITAAVTGQIDVTERQKPVVDRIQTAIEEAR